MTSILVSLFEALVFPTPSEKLNCTILHSTHAKLSYHFFLNCFFVLFFSCCIGRSLVYNMLQFSTVPIVKHWQYHNDVGENARLLPWWIVIPAPCKHQTMTPIPQDGSRGLSSHSCVFSRETDWFPTVLTQRDTSQVLHFYIFLPAVISHSQTTHKQCLSAIVVCSSIHSGIHSPSTCCILSRYDHKHQFILLKFYVKDNSVKLIFKLLLSHGVLFNPPSEKKRI